MGYKLPDFFPASDYHVQVTRPEVWKALSDLDRTFLGPPDDYLGFTSFGTVSTLLSNISAKLLLGHANVFMTFWFTMKFPS